MIKTNYRNRIEKTKIERHCSQLALKKSRVQNCTSKQQQTSLQQIRKTTFWVKRAIGPAGIENLPPNSKKTDELKNHVFSMKVQTQVSQTNSTCPQNNIQMDFIEEIDSKLMVVEKAQKQIISQVNAIVEQQLPRLSICHQLYGSLTKVLKLAYKNSNNPCSQVQKIIDNHIEAASSLFLKVLKHSTDFINANKCANLISKNIELQRQNSRFIDAISKIQLQDENIRSNQQNKNTSLNTSIQINSLKRIDYQRILITNYRALQTKSLSQQKLNELCHSILGPCLSMNNSQPQLGQFELNSNILNRLTNQDGGMKILKKFIDRRKNTNSAKSEQHLNILLIYNILDFKFQPLAFNIIRKNITKQSVCGFFQTNQHTKMNLKSILRFMGKLSFLNDYEKECQIIINLLSKVTMNGQVKLNEKQILEIKKIIEESKKYIYSKTQESTKNIKKLVNCSNLYQNRKSRSVIGEKKLSSIQNDLQTFKQLFISQTDILNKIELNLNQAMLLGYFFIADQLQFVKYTSLQLYKIFEFSEQSSLTFLKPFQRLICPKIYKNIENMDKLYKQSIINLASIVMQSYTNEIALAGQYKKAAIYQIFQIVKKEILISLDFSSQKLILSEIINDKNERNRNIIRPQQN